MDTVLITPNIRNYANESDHTKANAKIANKKEQKSAPCLGNSH